MPFLKKLKLHGFKSFAYKTELEFKDGVVCIVGPNGCGKSNIVDALKWGLGEMRMKSIRGENIVDIIFAGTEVHKPMGMAEIEIIIDNSDMYLPVKYNEVSIKRRIYRSGETGYFINKNKVRAKDIHDLFSDTGLGKGAYSFMEQGKIDMILSSKPEERRVIFEEAAGIARYKVRKKETLSKLESTNNNLSQVNVLLKELDNERASLSKQAKKAKIYNHYKDELKKLEVQLYGSRYKKNLLKINDINKKITELNDKKIKLKTENSSINSEIEKIKNQIFQFNQTKNKFEKDKLTFEQSINSNNEKIDIFKGLFKKNAEDIQLKKTQINNIINENQKMEKKIDSLKEELKKFRLKQEENEIMLISINEQRDILKNKKAQNFKEKEEFKNDINDYSKQIDKLRIELRNVTDEFVAEIDKKKKEVLDKSNGHINLKSRIYDLINKISDNIQDSHKSLEKIQEAVKELKELKNLIYDLTTSQDEFRNLIFNEKGPYAKKEKIDQIINNLMQDIIAYQNKISVIESGNEKMTKEISDLTDKYNELDKAKNDLRHYINNHNKDIHTNQETLIRNNSYLKNFQTEIKKIESENSNLEADIKKLTKDIEKHAVRCEEIDRKILKYEEDMNQQNEVITKRKDKISELIKNLEGLDSTIQNHIQNKYKTEAGLNESKLYLYHEFNVTIDKMLDKIPDFINENDEKQINKKTNQMKQDIKELGHVNLLAEELYTDVDKRYKFHVEQKEDLLKAQDDLFKIIEEVSKESEKIFLETFNQIKKNFHHLFRRAFNGGKADLILQDPDNVLESGIEINAQPPGKKIQTYSWLSGGERSLLAVVLMFSIFLVKPSPFCVLDEIDAALDEQNNLKFLKIMREFSSNTQFFIVTHNKQTIVNSDYLYGITMEEKGISKVVSMELKKEKIDDYIK